MYHFDFVMRTLALLISNWWKTEKKRRVRTWNSRKISKDDEVADFYWDFVEIYNRSKIITNDNFGQLRSIIRELAKIIVRDTFGYRKLTTDTIQYTVYIPKQWLINNDSALTMTVFISTHPTDVLGRNIHKAVLLH